MSANTMRPKDPNADFGELEPPLRKIAAISWGRFKELVEGQGVTDGMLVKWIDYGGVLTPQVAIVEDDPEGHYFTVEQG